MHAYGLEVSVCMHAQSKMMYWSDTSQPGKLTYQPCNVLPLHQDVIALDCK